MTMEGFQNESVETNTDWVLGQLAERLKKIRIDLGIADANEDPDTIADDEDRDEAGEEKDTRQAIGDELLKEEQEILGAMKWIKEHGDTCAFPGCANKVGSRRRAADPASITCTEPEHMEAEDSIVREIAMGL